VVHGPTIRTLPLAGERALDEATAELLTHPPDVVMLTTGLGLRGWLAAAESVNRGEALRQAWRGALIYARGPKAAGAATTAGLDVAWKAPNALSAEMVDRLCIDFEEGRLPGRRVAVQLDGSDDTWIQDRLRAAGLDVVPVPVYRWTFPADTRTAVRLMQSIADRTVDAVTFTAGPAVANFFALADEHGLLGAVLDAFNADAVTIVCVGPVCAARARKYGVAKAIEPVHTRLGAMVQACVNAFAERTRFFRLGGHDVTVQGRFVVIDEGEPISLSDRERGVLDALSERPGVVQSKTALLKAVWGGGESDEHVVEVTLGRLRQRLGIAGAGIETVVRRGYRLAAD
jgi:uroporphyrinogen-III synthase